MSVFENSYLFLETEAFVVNRY